MADFPGLAPTQRNYTLAQYPVSEERGFAGGNVRFKHGPDGYGFQLKLAFTALTQANAKLIRDHYRSQQGGYIAFLLPNAVWIGHDNITAITPATSLWRYAAPIQETHRPEGRIDISVDLISIPYRYGGAAYGLISSQAVALTAGTAAASSGLGTLVAVTLTAGTATGS